MTSSIWKEPVTGPVWLDTNGLHGDRVADTKVHGGPWRAVLMYSSDHFPRWRQEWNRRDVTAGAFGENLTVRGVQESTACLGDRFEIGEALIEVTSPRGPCWKLARRHGVPDSAILEENAGRTTSESMRAVAGMLEVRGLQTALLVSDPFHMLRLRILARRFGFTPYTSPTQTSPISPNREERWKYIFSESLKAPLAFFFERKL